MILPVQSPSEQFDSLVVRVNVRIIPKAEFVMANNISSMVAKEVARTLEQTALTVDLPLAILIGKADAR